MELEPTLTLPLSLQTCIPETYEVSYPLNQFGLSFLLPSSETEPIDTIVSQKPKEVRPSARSDQEYFQGSSGETDIENRLMDVVRGEGRVRCMERVTWKLTLLLLLLLSHFSRVRLCAPPQMAAHQAPPSLGFSRQEHWSGWPFPSPMHESEK